MTDTSTPSVADGEALADRLLDTLNQGVREGVDPRACEAAIVGTVVAVFAALDGPMALPHRLRILADEIEQAARPQ